MFHKLLVLLVLLSLLLVGCGDDEKDEEKAAPTATPEPVADTGVTLVIGDISNEPSEVFQTFQALADYLAANLKDAGVSAVEIKVAPDIPTMAEWMKSGEIDLYFDSLYPSMMIIDASGAKPILRRWKGGTSAYHTVFYTKADSGIESLEDLSGHMIVFEEEFSTSGFMLPMAYLIEAGLNPVEKSSPTDTVAADEVGYVFALEDVSIMEWVTRDRVAAGVNDSQVFEEILAETSVELRVLAETEDIPRQLAIVSPNLDPAVVEALTALLMGLDEAPDGAPVLEVLETAQFDEFPEGLDAALARMQELYQTVTNR